MSIRLAGPIILTVILSRRIEQPVQNRRPLPHHLAAVLLWVGSALSAQQPAPTARLVTPAPEAPADAITAGVFRRLAPAVARVEVLELGSDAKVGVGSAFLAAADGRLITNFHVIARLVHAPTQHEARVTLDGRTVPVRVLAVDVVRDLAVLTSAGPPALVLAPTDGPLPKGTRVLALGHPQDLGLSIVEGTYNGFVDRAAVPRLHFTGAINPGMSGGPAVTEDGRLVGVNVATMGNEVGFLVPAAAVTALLASTPAEPPPAALLKRRMADQLKAVAEATLRRLFAPGVPTAVLGAYRVPTLPDTTFRCWGDTDRPEAMRLEWRRHNCSMEEQVFLSETLNAGFVSFDHAAISGPPAGSARRLAALAAEFGGNTTFDGTRREVTRFECTDANRRTAAFTWRTRLCVRRLRDFPGLYEALFHGAVLGRDDAGLVSSLSLSGVPFELIRTLPDRFLAAIRSR